MCRSSADTQRLLDDRIQIHVGGVPADIPVPMYHASSRNYIGCMRDLIVDGDRIGLSGESKDERRTASHNVEDGCRDQPLEKCNGCEGEACVDYLMEGKPYCDCEVVGAICETAGKLANTCCITYVLVQLWVLCFQYKLPYDGSGHPVMFSRCIELNK